MNQKASLVAIAIILASCIFSAASAPVIGILAPSSSSVAWASGDWQRAAQLSVDNWNVATPFTSGTVSLVAALGDCTPNGAYSALSTLSSGNPTLTGVVGPLCSASQVATLPLAGYLQIPMIVPANVAPSLGSINATLVVPQPLSSASTYMLSFRPPPSVEARALVAMVGALNWSTIAVVWTAGGCSEDEATAFVQTAQKSGILVTPLPVASPVTDMIAVSKVFGTLTATGIKQLVLFGCGSDMLVLLRGAKNSGMITNGYFWLFSSGATATVQADTSSGELRALSDGYVGVTLMPNATSSGAASFVTSFYNKYTALPDSNAFFWWQATQFLLTGMAAHEAAGYTLDGSQATNSALMTTLSATTITEGRAATISFSYTRQRTAAPFAMWNFKTSGDLLLGISDSRTFVLRQRVAWPTYNQLVHVGIAVNGPAVSWYPGTFHLAPQLLFERFNARGILPNITIVPHIAYTAGTASGGFDAIQLLLAGWPDIFTVLGAVSELDSNPIIPFSNRYSFAQITGSVANQDYLDQNSFPQFSRVGPSPTSEVRAILALIQSYGWKRIGWAYSLRAYSNQQYQIAATLAPSYNITIVLAIALPDSTNTDPATSELQQFKTRDIRIIVCATVVGPVVRWFRAAAALGMNGAGYVWIANSYTMNTVGAYATSPSWAPLRLNATNLMGVAYYYDEVNGPGADFRQLYADYKNVSTSTLKWTGTAASVYDWVDTANFFLEAFVNFTRWGNTAADRAKFTKYVRSAQMNLTCSGSPLVLDPSTGDRRQAYFAVGQYQYGTYVPRGTIRGNLVTVTSPIQWMGGVTDVPLDAAALQPFLRSQAQAAVVTVLVVLLLICLVVLAFILWKFRDVPHFRGSTPSFDAIILLGAALAVLSSLLYVQNPASDSDCTFRMWGIGIAGPFTFAPLFVKTYRIERIFSITQLQTLRITDAQLMQGFIALMCVPAALLLVVSVEPSQRSFLTHELDATGNYLVACCTQSPLYLFGMLAFTALLCAWGAKTAWGVRSVPDNYNESFNTAICLVFLICYLCLVIPLQMIMQTDPNALSLLRSIGILLGIAMSVSVLFVPKVLRLLPGRHKNIMTFTAAPREETGLRYASNRDSPKAGPRGSRPNGSNHSDITTNPGNGSTLGTVTGNGYVVSGAQLSSRPNQIGAAGTPTAAQRGSTASLLSPQQMTSSVSPINAGTPPTAQPAWAATPPSMERNISTAQPSPVSLDSIKTGQSASGTPILGSARRGGAAPLATLSDGPDNGVALGRVI